MTIKFTYRDFYCGIAAALTATLLCSCGGSGAAEAPPLGPLNARDPAARSLQSTDSQPASSSIATHVMTADYVSSGNDGYLGPATTIAKYATWAADPSPALAAGYTAAGMKIYGYTNPDRAYRSVDDFAYQDLVGPDAGAIARTCSGSMLTSRNGVGILTDPRKAQAVTHTRNIIAHRASMKSGLKWDAWFIDDFDAYGNVDNGTACNFTTASWQKSSISMLESVRAADSTAPFITNGLNVDSSHLPILYSSSVIGAMYEECYNYPGLGLQGNGSFHDWTVTENYELAIAALNKNFWCFANLGEDAATSKGTSDRAYVYASFVLTYGLGSSIVQWAGAPTSSRSQIMPEAQLVPTQPLLRAPQTVAALHSSSGIYFREYAACFKAGSAIGPCAAIVNPDRYAAHSVAGLSRSYKHALQLHGSDSIDGGTFATGGSAPNSLGPLAGTIVFN